MGVVLLTILTVLLTILTVSQGTASTHKSHFQPCPRQWTQHSTSCYRLNSTAVGVAEAGEGCERHQAHLVVIEDSTENDFLRGFMGVGTSSVWLGARYDHSRQKWLWSGHSNTTEKNSAGADRWRYGESPPAGHQDCSALSKDGWWDPVGCTDSLSVVCEMLRPCVAGWYGANCSAQCRCRDSDACSRQGGLCPRGCLAGWTGASCDTENPVPEATFHCLKSNEDLNAELTVDVKGRRYRVIHAVSQEGKALSCTLPKVTQRSDQVFITLTLKGAFADVNDTDDVDDGVTHSEVTSAAPTPSPHVTRGQEPSTRQVGPVVGHVETTPAGIAAVTSTDSKDAQSSSAGQQDTVPVPVPVTATASWESQTDAVKRDVQSGQKAKNSSGEECLASRAQNGTVTWLIEFKEFPEVVTGNDVTVELMCDPNEADSLESVDSLLDNSERQGPVEAAMMPVVTSVYLTDAHTGQRAEQFHLGQHLHLHVDIEGLEENECAYPHSCVIKPKDAPGHEFVILDQLGCANRRGPVSALRASQKGHFVSNAFPALSLGISAVQLECQVHVEPTASFHACQSSCRAV